MDVTHLQKLCQELEKQLAELAGCIQQLQRGIATLNAATPETKENFNEKKPQKYVARKFNASHEELLRMKPVSYYVETENTQVGAPVVSIFAARTAEMLRTYPKLG